MKTALITGITGQDGAYLAELLLGEGYEVHGIKRRASSFNTDRIDHLYQDPHESDRHLILHYGDLTDANLIRIVQETRPDEIYNLACPAAPGQIAVNPVETVCRLAVADCATVPQIDDVAVAPGSVRACLQNRPAVAASVLKMP